MNYSLFEYMRANILKTPPHFSPLNIDLLLTLFALCCLALLPLKSDATEVLKVRISEKAFPAGFKVNDRWQGMDIDVLDEITKRTGIQYQVVVMPFQRAMTEIAKGEIDLIANLTKNPQRSLNMDWLGPVRVTQTALVVQKSNPLCEIESIDQLIQLLETSQQQIGHVIGVSYSPMLDDYFATNQRFKAVVWDSATRWQIVEMLQKGRIFGFFQDEFEARSLIAANQHDPSHPYAGFSICPTNIDSSTSGAYFGLSKHLDPAIHKKLLAAFAELESDGTLATIYQKWDGSGTDPNNPLQD
ncbi:transporter substrate-binding domain-containing protein [Aliiglaciecola sp. CAU 1673]|uniref:substrate-binding periplasmic protein n=1 Tax=Aliiglaciecola sp. CAU 1673 TaxID=3032595 RepID=UPI0023DBE087|nr:transporter substrate-binding domain-containing protein [Aliiglaciecola sp. CAU 1673]MDF2178378.1 transporter substrate-binding domain-containing protein [Aliiglaciecola sp. CAU 1673]